MIENDSISFLSNKSVLFKCINDKEKLININDCIKRYKSNYNELIIDNITIPEKLIEDIYKNNNNVLHSYLIINITYIRFFKKLHILFYEYEMGSFFIFHICNFIF